MAANTAYLNKISGIRARVSSAGVGGNLNYVSIKARG